LPNKSSFEHKVDNNNGLVATDPIYNGYPTEFGYFGSCSSQKSSYNLQLSNLSSDSSNFYCRRIVQDETVYPRNYSDIISYDATVQTSGFTKSAVTSGWKKTVSSTSGLPGQPGSLYSIRKEPPLAQGSCWIMPSPYQVNLVNTGLFAINVTQIGTGYVSFENDYNSNIDYTSLPVRLIDEITPYPGVPVTPIDKNTGKITNVLVSGYKNGNAVMWKPNTRFFIGNIIYVNESSYTLYYIVTKTGITGDITPNTTVLNTNINDPISGVSTCCTYAYIGTTYPVRKKWLPSTHYNIGDVISKKSVTYVVTNTTGTGLSGSDYGQINTVYGLLFGDGELTCSSIPWHSTDPGFGYIYNIPITLSDNTVLQRFPVTFNWTPNTYMAEGTIGIVLSDIFPDGYGYFCVYKAGISGLTMPIVTDGQLTKDGTAYIFTYPFPSPTYYDEYPQLGAGYIRVPSGTLTGYVNQIISTNYTQVIVQQGNISFMSMTAVTENRGQNVLGKAYFTPRAPYIINTNNFINNRYNVLPWASNTEYFTGEYLYYGSDTYNITKGGISGNTPPQKGNFNQTNGTLSLYLIPYTDPYKGCLLKITQTEDSDSTFNPYYARILSYNPNTNIVNLETPLPITEKRCLYEILSFSYDNYSPFQYTVNPFFDRISSPMIFYDITLVSLTLPNLPVYSANNINILTSGQSQPFDSYPKVSSFPYIIVTFKNVNSLDQAIPSCSNNPKEYSATFRVPVTDANPNLTAPFTRLSSNETKTLRFNANNSFRLTITDPRGNILIFANPFFFNDFINFISSNTPFPDTIRYITGSEEGFGLGYVMGSLLPIPPSSTNQVSVTFSVRPHIT
jgi:hypothetical protein